LRETVVMWLIEVRFGVSREFLFGAKRKETLT
jgi:hypothetical protein